ncbi:phosphatidylserine decarboxylase [uncultured Pigmentiphaga sp.]|uniref:phosphatidylserine decarboxylase n=1 Tax=uncultured Pigmentiphaga sp. TaxID=340361 RepID=UPI00262BCA86|nr:phosphatidylserine decarboxylase [uncultured Pigmentiphaga sp.]
MELAVTLGLYLMAPWLAILGVLLVLYTFYFFRDPDRFSPQDDNVVLAAADGVVSDIVEIEETEVVCTKMRRIAIFLSVFDVHTNRAPIDGKIIYSQLTPGKMLDARHPDATRVNEFRTWGFQGARTTIVVRQITGMIARRIVAWSKVGDLVKRGDRFGMIRFGSRTEIYVPLDAEVLVSVGQRVQGGVTVIARLR